MQDTVQHALKTILGCAHPLDIVCAGRTDAGVHARGQVAHVDVPVSCAGAEDARSLPSSHSILRRFIGVLPEDVCVRAVTEVSSDFDARFSAVFRRYAYRIADTPQARDPLRVRDVLDHPRELDIEAMNDAALSLVGEHDFAAFCRARPFASTVRKVSVCSFSRDTAGRAVLDIQADAFCHSMVRAVVGALLAVGEHRVPIEWAGQVLTGGIRDPKVTVMPARGLTLEEVGYPPPEQWAARQQVTRAVRTPRFDRLA